MINRTIHFPSLIIGVSKALRGVSLTQVVANILQVQVQTPEKSKQSHHLSTKTIHSLWFDWATSCITSYLSPYPLVSQNREWMWSIWSICASDLSAISAWRAENLFIARVAMYMSQFELRTLSHVPVLMGDHVLRPSFVPSAWMGDRGFCTSFAPEPELCPSKTVVRPDDPTHSNYEDSNVLLTDWLNRSALETLACPKRKVALLLW